MSKSDFFTFITSLKPIELKAIGELSQTLHLEEGVAVYESGDASDAIYIINRGALEVVHEASSYGARTPLTYLTRGDMFGETETLGDVPRKNAVRTCEPASIQQFEKKLSRTHPAGAEVFYYLSQQIATQVTKMNDLAFVQSACLELSGNLANFDMVTIYQTILNSAQTGELSISNEHGEQSSVFHFEEGQTRYGRYYHLTGEEAFWQLFLCEKLSGTFSFSIAEPVADPSGLGPRIHRNPTDLLITALQYRDEFKGMQHELPEPDSILRREKLNLDWPDPEYESVRGVAEMIWQLCYSTEMALDELCHDVPVCELKFFKTVCQLVRTGHFSLTPAHHGAHAAV